MRSFCAGGGAPGINSRPAEQPHIPACDLTCDTRSLLINKHVLLRQQRVHHRHKQLDEREQVQQRKDEEQRHQGSVEAANEDD